MNRAKKKDSNGLSIWQGASIITGYGIAASLAILTLALVSSAILHLMIAELSLRSRDQGQIISAFSEFLFNGRNGKLLTYLFFILMAFVLVFNLAAYIEGASEIINPLLQSGTPS